jgi:hypothetical protein
MAISSQHENALAAALQEEIGTDNITVIVESPKWKCIAV